MLGLRELLSELLQAFDVQIQCFSSVGKGFAQIVSTGDDVWEICKLDSVRVIR